MKTNDGGHTGLRIRLLELWAKKSIQAKQSWNSVVGLGTHFSEKCIQTQSGQCADSIHSGILLWQNQISLVADLFLTLDAKSIKMTISKVSVPNGSSRASSEGQQMIVAFRIH